MKFALIFLIALLSQTSSKNHFSQTQLYPIHKNGYYGYINEKGTIIISPKYRNAGKFSEGLAPVRLNGTYGYINTSNNYQIPSKYDMAGCFKNGIAKVYLNGIAQLINKQGKQLFKSHYHEIFDSGNKNCYIVRGKEKNYGLIDKRGNVLVDTLYSNIDPFIDGLSIVENYDHRERGVVNLKGKFVVAYKTYRGIINMGEGMLLIDTGADKNYEYIINTTANVKIDIPKNEWNLDYDQRHFSNGLAPIKIKRAHSKARFWSTEEGDYYMGMIDTKGNIILQNENWQANTLYYRHTTLVQNLNDEWSLIDKKGNLKDSKSYKKIAICSKFKQPDHAFINGYAVVQFENCWSIINTEGDFVIEPTEKLSEVDDIFSDGTTIFIRSDNPDGDSHYLYGYFNTDTKEIVYPQLSNISFEDFKHGNLTYAVKKEIQGYYNKKGELIYQFSTDDKSTTDKINIDFMNRGYCYASSPYLEQLQNVGGFGRSNNKYKNNELIQILTNNKFDLIVDTAEKQTYAENYKGYKMYVTNYSQDTLYLPAQDSRLYLNLQAKNKSGQWKDIEYLPSSWCGNSYHSVFLPPNYHWEFIIPEYDGEFKTLLRAKLTYFDNLKARTEKSMYSNEFEGTINPAQFWRKRAYAPAGIMDPYND